MKKSKVWLVITAIYLSGCSVILTKKSQNVLIKTDSKDCSVYLENVLIGKGDSIKKLVSTLTNKQVLISREGFKDQYDVLRLKRIANSYKWFQSLDVILVPATFGIWLFPMISSWINVHKCLRYDKVNSFSSGYAMPLKSVNQKHIELLGIYLKVNHKQQDIFEFSLYKPKDIEREIEKSEERHEKEKYKIEESKETIVTTSNTVDKILTSQYTRFNESAYKIIKSTAYADTTQSIFKDRSNTLYLEGEVSKVYFYKIFLRGADVGYTEPKIFKSKIFIKWYLKNSYDQIIDSIITEKYSGNFYQLDDLKSNQNIETQDYWNRSLDDAVENSYLSLFNSSRFIESLKKKPINFVPENQLLIRAPKNIVTNENEATSASVIIKTKDGHGSGFAITNDGYIITNYHVIAGKFDNQLSKVKVITSNGEELTCEIVRYNLLHDLALLKVDKQFEKAFQCNKTKTFKRFESVFTIGTPKSIELGQSVSRGIISNERKFNDNFFIQLSMSVNSGNSGGPLFTNQGDLHGIISSKLVGRNTEGVCFAIPSHNISDFLNLKFD